MQGGITNTQALKTWFNTSGKAFWTLRYYRPGAAGEVIARNRQEEDMVKSWELLEANVKAQASNSVALLQVLVYDLGKENNYFAITNINISPQGFQDQYATQAGVHGLSVSGGMLHSGQDIDTIKANLRKEWEMERRIEELENQIHADKDESEVFIRGIERLSNTPIGQILVAKLLGMNGGQIQALKVAGVPSEQTEAQVPTVSTDQEDTFEEDLAAITQILGVDDIELMRKLRKLVESNPEMAKTLLNT